MATYMTSCLRSLYLQEQQLFLPRSAFPLGLFLDSIPTAWHTFDPAVMVHWWIDVGTKSSRKHPNKITTTNQTEQSVRRARHTLPAMQAEILWHWAHLFDELPGRRLQTKVLNAGKDDWKNRFFSLLLEHKLFLPLRFYKFWNVRG